MLASGQTFKEVDVLGYDASGDSSHLAVDYSFGLTAAKTLSVDASGITQLDLEYGSEELQVYNQHPDGSFSSTPDEVSAWNRVTNVSGFNGQPVAAPLTLPSSGVSSETGDSSLHYYVRFTLNNGTALTVDANKLFALDDFSFSDDQTLNIGSQSSGAGAGKVTFDPLHLSFSQLGLDPTLFKMLASGQTFKEVDVLGYDASGDSSHLAVDYSFGLTAAKTLSVDASGVIQLDLEYGSQQILVNGPDPADNSDTMQVISGVASETIIHADHSKDIYLTNIPAQTFVAERDSYNSTGTLEFVDRTNSDGSHQQLAQTSNISLSSTPHVSDAFVSSLLGSDTFVFNFGSGNDSVSGFHAGNGPNHDVLELHGQNVTDFATWAGGHLHQATGSTDTIIDISSNDHITLKGVSLALLTTNDFHLIS